MVYALGKANQASMDRLIPVNVMGLVSILALSLLLQFLRWRISAPGAQLIMALFLSVMGMTTFSFHTSRHIPQGWLCLSLSPEHHWMEPAPWPWADTLDVNSIPGIMRGSRSTRSLLCQ